jgi:hypothetical protein
MSRIRVFRDIIPLLCELRRASAQDRVVTIALAHSPYAATLCRERDGSFVAMNYVAKHVFGDIIPSFRVCAARPCRIALTLWELRRDESAQGFVVYVLGWRHQVTPEFT